MKRKQNIINSFSVAKESTATMLDSLKGIADIKVQDAIIDVYSKKEGWSESIYQDMRNSLDGIDDPAIRYKVVEAYSAKQKNADMAEDAMSFQIEYLKDFV